jgi:hypothetical protein
VFRKITKIQNPKEFRDGIQWQNAPQSIDEMNPSHEHVRTIDVLSVDGAPSERVV